ncbi:hypothetical protein [Campylobacter lari]|uniref:hypothetical protein n=1 Tax=Campylobacter lari TaxID=201 RepID=UPI003530065C
MFCEEKFRNSKEYTIFWEELRSGKFQSGKFICFGKNNKLIHLEASYNPIKNNDGEIICNRYNRISCKR